MSDTHERATRVLDDAMRLLSQKNSTYQDAWKEQGWRGNLARIMSKVARLRNMLWRSQVTLMNGDKEHPRDTLLDVINCCVFAILNIDDGREWGHEQNLPEYAEIPYDPTAWAHGPGGEILHPHPEQPPAMTGQHHVVIPDVQPQPMNESGATQVAIAEPSHPSPQPRGNRKRAVKDVPQA
jgi:hypothetical protein